MKQKPKNKVIECMTRLTSERIYITDPMGRCPFDTSLKLFNQAKYFAYNEAYKTLNPTYVESERSLHDRIVDKYNLSSYYAHSAQRLGEGTLNSQKTLQEDRIEELKQKVKDIGKTLSYRQAEITKKENDARALEKYISKLNQNPEGKHKLTLNCFGTTEITGYKAVKGINLKKETEETTVLKLLYKDLYPALRRARNKHSQTQYFYNNTVIKLENAQKIKKVQFCQNKQDRRYNYMQLSGRSDSDFKNYPVHVTPFEKDDTIKFKVEFQLYDKTRKEFITEFPHGSSLLKEALASEVKFPIAFGLEKRYDACRKRWYLIFDAVFDLRKIALIPGDIIKGAIGIDLNVGHIDFCETDRIGNPVEYGSIPYTVTGSSEENNQSLNKALRQVTKLADKKGKPIIIEKLDTKKSKWKSTYRDKALNRTYHLFPYARYTRMITRLALEYNTEVFEVNPAMTSIIGSLKYARTMNLPSHIAAAYVIARRGQGFEEKIPKAWKPLAGNGNNWKQWSNLWKVNEKLVKAKFGFANNERVKSNILLPSLSRNQENEIPDILF